MIESGRRARQCALLAMSSLIVGSIQQADAAIAITRLWMDGGEDAECGKGDMNMLVHPIGVCTAVNDDGNTYTDKAYVDGTKLIVGGYDEASRCDSGADPDDIVEQWHMDGKCHHGEYKDESGKTVHFRYKTEVYEDMSLDLTTPNDVDGVRIQLYQSSSGASDWCGGGEGENVSSSDVKFGECISLHGVDSYHYRIVQFKDPSGDAPAEFLVQAYADSDCTEQKYMWAEVGGQCWGDAEVGFSFELATYPRTDVTPTPTPIPTTTTTTAAATTSTAPAPMPPAESPSSTTTITRTVATVTSTVRPTRTSVAAPETPTTTAAAATTADEVPETTTADTTTTASTADEATSTEPVPVEETTTTPAEESTTSTETPEETETGTTATSEEVTSTTTEEPSTTTEEPAPVVVPTTTAENTTTTTTSTAAASGQSESVVATPSPSATPSGSDTVQVTEGTDNSGGSNSTGAIVGGVVGGVAGAAVLAVGALYGARRLRGGGKFDEEDAFNTGLVVNSRAYSPATAEAANPLYTNPEDSHTLV